MIFDFCYNGLAVRKYEIETIRRSVEIIFVVESVQHVLNIDIDVARKKEYHPHPSTCRLAKPKLLCSARRFVAIQAIYFILLRRSLDC